MYESVKQYMKNNLAKNVQWWDGMSNLSEKGDLAKIIMKYRTAAMYDGYKPCMIFGKFVGVVLRKATLDRYDGFLVGEKEIISLNVTSDTVVEAVRLTQEIVFDMIRNETHPVVSSIFEKQSSWGERYDLEEIREKLRDFIPSMGSVENPRKNPSLEKYRKASNVVHDIFNNGLINLGRELKVLGIQKSDLRLSGYCGNSDWNQIDKVVEEKFTPIILNAALEQGIISNDQKIELLAVA